MNILKEMYDKKVIDPPDFVPDSVQYLVYSGSQSYGCHTDTSDFDTRGFCIPPKEYNFPHTAGEIQGFSTPKYRFDQYATKNAVLYKEKEYDFQVYNIVKYFRLAMECSPELLDTLFVPDRCVIYATEIGKKVRENRNLFLTRHVFHTLVGYAHGQLKKIKSKTPAPGSKREQDVLEHGVDTKYIYHIVRLALQCEQAMTLGTMDLERDRELYKAIRRGEWTADMVENFLIDKEIALRKVYEENETLPLIPDEKKIKTLLLSCLEIHYGDLSKAVIVPDKASNTLREISKIIREYER